MARDVWVRYTYASVRFDHLVHYSRPRLLRKQCNLNATVLSGMAQRARRWFLIWGLLLAVFVVQGLLPWFIVWFALPGVGPLGALTATFSSDPSVVKAVKASAPPMPLGEGTFLVLLFLHWLFLEPKHYGIPGGEVVLPKGFWFYAVASILLATVVWFALRRSNMLAFAAVFGSCVFFITHGFKENAARKQRQLAGPRCRTSQRSRIWRSST
jgi:hypothetical protein